jgi:type IV pilus assembly protein PilV
MYVRGFSQMPVAAQAVARARRSAAAVRVQAGASLVEILVSVLILTLGLLGMAAMQTRALQGNLSAGQRSQATMLSHYIMDVMRVDRERARGGDYNTGTTPVCASGGFGSGTLANNTLTDWTSRVKSTIGRSDDATTCVRVTCQPDYACVVEIFWDDSKVNGGLAEQSVVVSSRV